MILNKIINNLDRNSSNSIQVLLYYESSSNNNSIYINTLQTIYK